MPTQLERPAKMAATDAAKNLDNADPAPKDVERALAIVGIVDRMLGKKSGPALILKKKDVKGILDPMIGLSVHAGAGVVCFCVVIGVFSVYGLPSVSDFTTSRGWASFAAGAATAVALYLVVYGVYWAICRWMHNIIERMFVEIPPKTK